MSRLRSLLLIAFVALVVIGHVDSVTTAQITAQGNALSSIASAIPILLYQQVGTEILTRWQTDSTNYYPTTVSTGWCAWAGVICDSTLMVTAIGTTSSAYSIFSPSNTVTYKYANSLTQTYTNNNGLPITLTEGDTHSLTGTIPAAISILTTLQVLDFYSNQLTGTLPSELGALTALTHLNLGSNYFIGTVPSTLSALTNLDYLYLNETLLSGTIPSSLVAQKLYSDVALTIQNVYSGLNSIATINSIKAQGAVMCSMTNLGTNSITPSSAPTSTGSTFAWKTCTGTNTKVGSSYNQYIKKPSYWYQSYTDTLSFYPYQPPWCKNSWAGVTCDTTGNKTIDPLTHIEHTLKPPLTPLLTLFRPPSNALSHTL